MNSPHWPIVLIELVLVFGGVLAFAWWQLRDVHKAQRARREEAPPRRLNTGAVLLAAGVAERMGGKPKALLERDGVPLARRAAQALAQAGVSPIVVVTGHHAEALERALQGLDVTWVRNPRPEDGQVASQRLGLQALLEQAMAMATASSAAPAIATSPLDAIVVALADQPLIEAPDITALIQAFRSCSAEQHFVVPWVGDQPGNPVIFSAEVARQILAAAPDTGGRQWRSAHPEAVQRWTTDNRHYRVDIDTPEDLKRLEREEGVRLQWPEAT